MMRSIFSFQRWISCGCARLAFSGLAAFCALTPIARAQSPTSAIEYRVKAAYLYNFTKFIEWPPPAAADDGRPFVLGVVDSVGTAAEAIQEALRGKRTPGGRIIEVRRLASLSGLADCHQIFVTRNSGITAEAVRAAANGSPVLVVGETEDFAARGGTIGLVASGDAVRCEVNLAGAGRAGLKLSGRLASVARLVRETSSP
ncbi:MAG TPA: YfiR family protein [Candidatus Synoicihabitans sp.]|nr:YfiR family protein [Candidatus Synoicihabitans sp.]